MSLSPTYTNPPVTTISISYKFNIDNWKDVVFYFLDNCSEDFSEKYAYSSNDSDDKVIDLQDPVLKDNKSFTVAVFEREDIGLLFSRDGISCVGRRSSNSFPTFEYVFSFAEDHLRQVREMFSLSCKRLSLFYVDNIKLNSSEFEDIKSYFNNEIIKYSEFGTPINDFNYSFSLNPFDKDVFVFHCSMHKHSEYSQIQLRWGYYINSDQNSSIKQEKEHERKLLNKAHDYLHQKFEELITPKSRELFNKPFKKQEESEDNE